MIGSVQSLRLLQNACRSSLHVACYCYDCSGSSTASSRLHDSVCTERACAVMQPENKFIVCLFWHAVYRSVL
jgi:hypothetical protein